MKHESHCTARSRLIFSPMETDLPIHDPSTLIKQGNLYWVFGTGRGCPAFSSADRVHWTLRGSVFTEPPAWIKEVVPKNTNNLLWAPDIYRARDTYYLYYSVSTFGSNVSAIGLATSRILSRTIFASTWTDQGVVVRSEARDNFNAIDPCVFSAPDGRLWLAFGSFWSGIKMIELDPASGKRIAPSSPLYSLASHPQERNNAIEAPFLHYRKGYYYLFVNWDYCCRGAQSTYNLRVGRSPRITGPYRDRDGMEMMKGGGTALVPVPAKTVPGVPPPPTEARFIGPGHAGILTEASGSGRGSIDRFSFHWEYARQPDGKGRSQMEIGSVEWGRDGWPRIHL